MSRSEKEIAELRQEIAKFVWFHSIDLGDGIVTPGRKSVSLLKMESDAVFQPVHTSGRSVLDVGAWNGAQTVEAIRRGAGRVMAVDELTWTRAPWHGKASFELVMAALGFDVPTKIMDAQKISVQAVGKWDIVLFLGVLYHLFDPIVALQRLAEVTKEVLVVETHLDARHVQRPAMIFYPGSELAGDPTNWWGPNQACVEALLRKVGFALIKFTPHPLPELANIRGIFHAWKTEDIYHAHNRDLAASQHTPVGGASAGPVGQEAKIEM